MTKSFMVEITEVGMLTLPREVREALDATGRTQVEIEVDGHEVRLRPTVTIPREDHWALAKHHVAQLERALDDIQAGRLRNLRDGEEMDTTESS